MRVEFVIPGKPKGYVRRTRKSLWTPSVRAYHAWMNNVTNYALYAGLFIPLIATPKKPVMMDVTVYLDEQGLIDYMGNATFPDGDNIVKAIADALCYVSKDRRKANKILKVKHYGDKFVYGRFVGVEAGEDTETRVVLEWKGGGDENGRSDNQDVQGLR